MNKVLLSDNPLRWEERSPKEVKIDDSSLVTRTLKISLHILTFIPTWGVNTVISLMIVPSQIMKTRIFRIVDGIGIFRNAFAPPYRNFRESCENRHYQSFDIETVELKTRHDDIIRGTLLRSKLATKDQKNVPTVICFCPNSRPMTNWGTNYNDPIDYVDKAYKWGYAVNVLMLDYPGVGESDGVAHAPYMQEMAETAYEFTLKGLNVHPNHIHLHGWSLGSFPAAYLANYDRTSKGLIFCDRGGVSIVKSASELLELAKTTLRKIAYIGRILVIPPAIAQGLLGGIAKMGGWEVFNTAENLLNTQRDIYLLYSKKDEVFNGKASYGHVFDDWKAKLIELHPNEKANVYHHGVALTHSFGKTKTKEVIGDIIGHNVAKIIEKSYGKASFSLRKRVNTSTSDEPSISKALQMLGSEVLKKGLNLNSFFKTQAA